MAITVAMVFWSEASPQGVSDSLTNYTLTAVSSLEDVASYLDELDCATAVDAFILPEDFEDSELAVEIQEQLEPLEEGCYMALMFLVYTENEDVTEKQLLDTMEDIEVGLATGNLGLVKSSITAMYAYQIIV